MGKAKRAHHQPGRDKGVTEIKGSGLAFDIASSPMGWTPPTYRHRGARLIELDYQTT